MVYVFVDLKRKAFYDLVADKCHKHPCKNDAKCVQLLSKIKCICSPGYKGQFCQGN